MYGGDTQELLSYLAFVLTVIVMKIWRGKAVSPFITDRHSREKPVPGSIGDGNLI